MSARIGLIGGRGYTGGELLGLISAHPQLELAFATSGSQAGQSISDACEQWPDTRSRFISMSPDQVSQYSADAWVLAMPNGVAPAWADAIANSDAKATVLDLGADFRFDRDWVYGLPEHNREQLAGAKRIANPGCYATAAQLALEPLQTMLTGMPRVFGVSGYSGAGKTPSDKNNPERLRDNLIPYALTGHVHESEISDRIGRDVSFLPHVASFFRGISLTISATLDQPMNESELFAHFADRYAGEPLVRVSKNIPEVADVVGTPASCVGGFVVDSRNPSRVTMVSVLDNLAKGAATQAMQNLNLALGFEETTGLGDLGNE